MIGYKFRVLHFAFTKEVCIAHTCRSSLNICHPFLILIKISLILILKHVDLFKLTTVMINLERGILFIIVPAEDTIQSCCFETERCALKIFKQSLKDPGLQWSGPGL